MLISTPGRHCGVLGDPIGHSLSPVLHRAAYAELGLDWSYDAHRVPAGGLAAFLGDLDPAWRGLSLTMPLKREAMPLLDAASDRGVRAGAVNTIVIEGAEMVGHNTDIPGAARALRERYAGPLDAATVVGGGATAASVLLAFAELGCRRFTLLVRDPARTEETLAAAGRFPEPLDVRVAGLAERPDGEVLVSTIPAEAQSDLVAGWSQVPVLFDVVYHPRRTPLVRSAGDRVVVSGLDLLVHQAAIQVELFAEQPAPLAVMRQAGEAALAERT